MEKTVQEMVQLLSSVVVMNAIIYRAVSIKSFLKYVPPATIQLAQEKKNKIKIGGAI